VKTLKVYRNGAATLAERISKALAHFSIHNAGRLPAAVIVHKRNVAGTTEVLKALGVDLTVIEDGGPLAGEVWLLIASGGDPAPGTAIPADCPTQAILGAKVVSNLAN